MFLNKVSSQVCPPTTNRVTMATPILTGFGNCHTQIHPLRIYNSILSGRFHYAFIQQNQTTRRNSSSGKREKKGVGSREPFHSRGKKRGRDQAAGNRRSQVLGAGNFEPRMKHEPNTERPVAKQGSS